MTALLMIWRMSNGSRWRSVSCGLAITATFLIFGVVAAIGRSLEHSVRATSDNRLVVVSRQAMNQSLPLDYIEKIASVPGVAAVTPRQWFGAWYGSPTQGFVQYVVDPTGDLATHPEYLVAADERRAFLAGGRGVLVGRQLARRFGWKTGDNITLNTSVWPQERGNEQWEFSIAGIFDVEAKFGVVVPDAQVLLLDRGYFGEVLPYARYLAGWYVVQLKPGADATSVAHDIDARFELSPFPTESSTERLFSLRMARQLGDATAIASAVASAVIVALIFATALHFFQNTANDIHRFRTLHAIGFTYHRLALFLLAGACGQCLVFAAIGLLLAALVVPIMAEHLASVLPGLYLPQSSVLSGLGLALGIGILGAAMGWINVLRTRQVAGGIGILT